MSSRVDMTFRIQIRQCRRRELFGETITPFAHQLLLILRWWIICSRISARSPATYRSWWTRHSLSNNLEKTNSTQYKRRADSRFSGILPGNWCGPAQGRQCCHHLSLEDQLRPWKQHHSSRGTQLQPYRRPNLSRKAVSYTHLTLPTKQLV